MIRSPAIVALRKKYGKYLPHQRFNVDQVPLPFINGTSHYDLSKSVS